MRHRLTIISPDAFRIYSSGASIEAVRPFPVPIQSACIKRRDLYAGIEPGEIPSAVGERAQSEAGRVVDRASANSSVPISRIKNHGAVLQAQINIRRVYRLTADLEQKYTSLKIRSGTANFHTSPGGQVGKVRETSREG